MNAKTYLILLVVCLLLSACYLPFQAAGTPSPDAIGTAAAQTVQAQLTAGVPQASATVDVPADPPTPNPTNTQVFTPTNTPLPCLQVGYSAATIDQTVPDNTVMTPGQAFVKIWRLTNTGTCTWNSSYQMVFDHGDGMGAAANYAQPLTAGTVAPGQSVDVSVNLTAPASSGTYTGYWRFRDPNGTYFGIGGAGTWVVKIVVVNSVTVTLAPVVGVSGTLRAGAGPWPDYTIGESNTDITKTTEAFLTYDISGIPSNATITEAKISFASYSVTGNPFGLGILYGYVTDYGATLEPADFVPALPGGGHTLDWASTAALDNLEISAQLKAAIQAKLGSARFQMRLQFPGSNLDAVKDRLTLNNPSFIVKYTTP
jgi:hypothetical protein